MPQQEPLAPIVCSVCQGDARASVACQSCRAAGLSLPSPDGSLIWNTPLDRFSFSFRKTAKKINLGLNIIAFLAALSCLSVAIVYAFYEQASVQGWSIRLLISGDWFAVLFWIGLFLLFFAVFRASVYTDRVTPLPNWGKTHREIAREKERASKRKDYAHDVSVYFHPMAWDVLETAFDLAEKTGRMDVSPIHLFSAALVSPFGGIFMTRLGLDIATVRPRLVPLMQKIPVGTPTMYAPTSKVVLLRAYLDAREAERRTVGVTELFLQAFLADKDLQDALDAAGYPPEHVRRVAEWIRIQERLKEEHGRFVSLAAFKPKSGLNRTMTARVTPLLNRLSEDLTLLARDGYIAPVVTREREIGEILRAFESGRRGVVLVGETGVGKTSIVEDLARRMVEEDVPQELFDKRLVSVNLAELVASGESGTPAERVIALMHEVAMSGNIVLVLEGIEALAGGGVGGPMDLAETFAVEWERAGITVIGTTTPSAWGSFLERRTLGTKMAKIDVPEVSSEEAIRVLMAKIGYVEFQNHVFFSYGALEKCVSLAGRFLKDQRLPDSAINLAKEAAVLAHKTRGERSLVLAEDVARIVHEKTNIPVESVSQNESEKLLHLEDRLHARVIGQSEAVTAVSQAIRRARAEVREGKRPIANFLFLGPTGVGKTELSKALAAEYFGSETAMVRLDMSEFQHPSSVARMIGTPGDERGGWFTEAVRKNPFTIVLLDELEKAHPDILTLFLQVMDDGRLTDGVGRTVDFTNVVLIATSNAGTQFIQDQVAAGTLIDQIKTALIERELKGTFRPEFLNRFDAVIVFKPLTLDDVTRIAWLMLNGIITRMEQGKGLIIRVEDEAVEELARAGFDPLFGARPLRRVIQERVENGLADLILRNAVGRKDTVVIKAGGKMDVKKAGG